jgi:hypothetical protein
VLGLGVVYIPLLVSALTARSVPQSLLAWAGLTALYLLLAGLLRVADFAAVWRFAAAALRRS